MKNGPRKFGRALLLAAIILLVLAITAMMIHSSIEAPDPASRTPKGAMPPEGEPMRPTP
ncbi:hypothetical protein [Sphingobium bisphenolivorans]|uniref:hypothetical protein n=1 Tax=Sphingobium bisphenolivorans TaxID=1335760 RepID=UPI0003B475DC|nr:hypothetical protein [Sphingobium bisphenolivorans]